METDLENNEWKAEAPYLASLRKENPFSVPEQYFNTLTDHIQGSVYAEQLKAVTGVPGFIVPDQYFEGLQDRILAEITDEEVLTSFPKPVGFNTPDLYFEKLQAKILAKTTAVTEEQVPPLTVIRDEPAKPGFKITRLWHSDLMKYASAACFILVTAFGLYFNQQSVTRENNSIDLANEQMLYDIDEQEIIDHVQGITMDKQTVSNTELESYILNNFSQNELSSAL